MPATSTPSISRSDLSDLQRSIRSRRPAGTRSSCETSSIPCTASASIAMAFKGLLSSRRAAALSRDALISLKAAALLGGALLAGDFLAATTGSAGLSAAIPVETSGRRAKAATVIQSNRRLLGSFIVHCSVNTTRPQGEKNQLLQTPQTLPPEHRILIATAECRLEMPQQQQAMEFRTTRRQIFPRDAVLGLEWTSLCRLAQTALEPAAGQLRVQPLAWNTLGKARSCQTSDPAHAVVRYRPYSET